MDCKRLQYIVTVVVVVVVVVLVAVVTEDALKNSLVGFCVDSSIGSREIDKLLHLRQKLRKS